MFSFLLNPSCRKLSEYKQSFSPDMMLSCSATSCKYRVATVLLQIYTGVTLSQLKISFQTCSIDSYLIKSMNQKDGQLFWLKVLSSWEAEDGYSLPQRWKRRRLSKTQLGNKMLSWIQNWIIEWHPHVNLTSHVATFHFFTEARIYQQIIFLCSLTINHDLTALTSDLLFHHHTNHCDHYVWIVA